MVSRPPHQAGFTYVWVLLAIAITSAVLAAAIELESRRAMGQRKAEYEWVIEQYRAAVASYRQAHPSSGVATLHSLEQLIQDDRTWPIRRHLRTIYPNPLTGRTDWVIRTDAAGEPIDVEPQAD